MKKFLEIIREAGAKITPQRKAVLNVLMDQKKPLTLSEIHSNCRIGDFASVYRTIRLFKDIGVANEIFMGERQPRYELAFENSPHHHITCIECGRVEKVDICVLDKVKQITKFKITDHTMEFSGLCPNCR